MESSDDEEEYEESGGGTRLFGFMFGNVDNSGDLDADYLDEDAKGHLDALAVKLSSELKDIELTVKSPQASADTAEQDYDEKNEDAVDYEDMDEPYEGPEVQPASEEDYLLPKKEYFSSEVSLATLKRTASVFDDENYDEDEEEHENEQDSKDAKIEVQTVPSSGSHICQQDIPVIPESGKALGDDTQFDSLETENLDAVLEDFQEEDVDANMESTDANNESTDAKGVIPLPILYTEGGTVILRFSEIFGVNEPLKKGEKRDHRYPIVRERYVSQNLFDIIEDDEEAFLKGSCQVFSSMHGIRHDISDLKDDDTEFAEYSLMKGGSQTRSQIEKQSSRTCVSAEPMKTEIMANLSLESQFKSKLYPLDQQDWEDRILWDDHSVVNRDSVGLSDDNLDAKMSFSNEAGKGSELNSNYRKLGENDDKFFFQRSPGLLESFDSGDSLRDANSQLLESQCHPQHLRLESRLEADKHNHNDLDGEDNDLELHQSDAVRRFSNSTFLNREFMEGSWLDDIIWEPQLTSVKPKLIFDLQDERMLFEILDNRDSEHVSLHAGAMIISRASHPDVSFERHGYHPSWQFNIANDKFYRNRKIPQQLQPNSNKRTAYGMKVHHAAPAVKLQTMKLKLSNKDLAHFHRPKALWYPHDNEVAVKEQGKLPTVGPMKIIIKSMGGKGSKLHVDAEETVTSVKAKASKKLDFKPPETVKLYYLGKELEDDKSLAAQGVPPNSLLHLVRTKLHVWPRAQKIPGENKSLRPPGAFKKKSDLSVKDGHVFLMEYCEERPLLLSNAGMGANLRTYYQKSSPSDQTGNALRTVNSSLGSVVVLEPTDKSPFLGDIKGGCHQSSLETNMYKAPIFPHRVQSTDYLLVRSAKGKLSIRRIDRIAVVGQQEPLMEVLTPGSKNLQTYILNRLLVYVYREFRAAEKRGVVPWIRADELSTQFPNLSDTIIRKKLKECAVLRKDANGHLFWSKKRDFSIPSEEDLKKFVLPENVCSHESMQAGLYRLKHLGITRLTLPTSISNAMSQIPDEAIALAAASHIERELQITPWNLSSNFVACTNHDRENIERLEITGVGDPSGRGLGFSYVRAAPKAPVSNSMVKKKAAAGRGGSTVTGTDADLRRLSMEAAREVLLKFNVPDEQIAKQTRWHRIAMIRKLSSEQAESGVKVDPSTISKYARGQRMSFLQLQQQTREKCQEIWDRQVQSLSAVDGDENESDSEANSDLDSFAGDLENLLDAEEFEVDDGTSESKHDKVDGVKGIKMRRRPSQTQAEEEIEDEAAEAAELCRLLMEADDEEDQKKNKKSKGETGLVPSSKPPISAGNLDRVKKMNKAQPIVSYFPKESWTRDSVEGERSFGKKKSDKMKMMKKTGTPSTTQIKTKVKILGDGLQIFKPKKSSRESFVCGACGQLGHMRTNKHCPRYREDIEIPVETTDPEKTSGKPTSLDSSIKSQQKMQKKKAVSKVTKEIDSPEGENISAKAKVLPVKFKHDNNPVEGVALSSEQPMTSSAQPASSDIESGSRSGTKINKIIISNKSKPEDTKLESHKPTIVIKPPMDTDKGETESHRPSIVIRPPASMDRGQVESHKPSIVIRPPADKEKEQTHKKIVFKRTKEIIDLDQVSQDGSTDFEYRKTKRIVELSSLEKHGKLEIFGGDSSLRRTSEQNRWWKDEEKRRKAVKSREMSIYEERMGFDEREGIAELRRYEETIRRDREEEERLKAKKKKKKKVRPEISDDYLEDYGAKRNDRRDRGVKRRPLGESPRYSTEYNPAAKRRRGGEVGLANVLERIVDTLRESREVSYLFLKPVSKKEAPDYLDIVERPMDLSTIKNKVRKMEYKNREEFRHDVAQITINAHLYNDGRNPGIPPLADQLLEICDYLLEEHHHSLSEAEAGI